MEISYLESIAPELRCNILHNLSYDQVVALEETSTTLRNSVRDCLTVLNNETEIIIPLDFITRFPRLTSIQNGLISVESFDQIIILAKSRIDRADILLNNMNLAESLKLFFDNLSAKTSFHYLFLIDLNDTIELFMKANKLSIRLPYNTVVNSPDITELFLHLDITVAPIFRYYGGLDTAIAEELVKLPQLTLVNYDEIYYDPLITFRTLLVKSKSIQSITTLLELNNVNLFERLYNDGYSYNKIKQFIPLPLYYYLNPRILDIFPKLAIANVILQSLDQLELAKQALTKVGWSYWRILHTPEYQQGDVNELSVIDSKLPF